MSDSQYTSVEVDRNKICYRGRDEEGREIRKQVSYRPSLFVPAELGHHKTYEGQPLARIEFNGIKEAREYVKRYSEIGNFDFYGNTNYQYAFISDVFTGKIPWDARRISVWKIDIEVGSENGFPDPAFASEEITGITIKTNTDIVCFGCGNFTPKNGEIYIKCRDEYDLIEKFIQYWEKKTPDVVTGWNIRFFDIPYIINRIKRLTSEDNVKRLSPWRNIRQRELTMLNKQSQVYEILGISVLDYIDLYRKFAKDGTSRESYALGYIAQLEIGKTKLEGTDEAAAYTLYKTDFQKFMEYNIQDVMLIQWLDDKLKLLELAFQMAYTAKCNFDDVLFQTRMWDCLVFNQFVEDKIAMPQNKRSEKTAFEGAFVKPPQVGMFKWLTSWDLTSLYPHLIMQYGISPEMIFNSADPELIKIKGSVSVEVLLGQQIDLSPLKKHNVCVTPNGMFFRTDRGMGFMPKLMHRMFNTRKQAKDEMLKLQQKLETCDPNEKSALESKIASLDNLQLAIKVTLNSAYGSFSNPGFRFYDYRIGQAITSAGQLSVLWSQTNINRFLNDSMKTVSERDFIVASDTDSMYIDMGDILKKFFGISNDVQENIKNIDMICKKVLAPKINSIFEELKEYTNAYEQKMIMKREVIADIGIWTSKKHYILNIWNSEGVQYKEPKLKIVGLEAVKASAYPKICREAMKKIFKELVTSQSEEKVQEMIANFKGEFFKMPLQDIATPRGVSDVSGFVGQTKSVPIHVKAALIHNELIKKKGLTKEIREIKDGEKLKFAYLKFPNPMQAHVCAFQNKPHKALELEQWVDYNMQYEKMFLGPMNNVLNVIGWSSEARNTLW
jgi:DNA polymerase elongation subunit (family B)